MSVTNTDLQQSTTVQQVDLDIDSWLGAPGAESIVTPATTEPAKPNVFSRNAPDLGFLDKEEDEKTEPISADATPQPAPTEAPAVEALFDNLEAEAANGDEEGTKAGRPRTDKSGLVGFLKKRIENKEMFAFDDYDEEKQSLDEYLGSLGDKDIEELWQANIDNIKSDVASRTPQEFFESLPEELQYAAKYVMDGGQDLKGLFQALASTEAVRELDPAKDGDQELIVRNYLQATGFGTSEEIDEELATWKDLGVLEKKAKQFKPKLDQMQEEVVQQQLAEQELRKQQQEQAAEAYMQNVFEALRPGEISGMKLDRKTQNMLYTGLVQPQYPSISGRPTNLLGHLLEKYQFVEPNYNLVAEALWLLADRDGYRQSLINQGRNQAVEQTVRQLKTEQSRKTGSSVQQEEPRRTSRTLPRSTNIFRRN